MLKKLFNKTQSICLANDLVGSLKGKTLNGLLIQGTLFDIKVIVDSSNVGVETSEVCKGVKINIPVVSNFSDALKFINFAQKRALLIIEKITNKTIDYIQKGISNKFDLVNTNFEFITEISYLFDQAKKQEVLIVDLRKPLPPYKEADGSILKVKSKIILITGTDCGLGKRTTAYALAKESSNNGFKTAFVATGQTGIMLGSDAGIVLDSLPLNFVSGELEKTIVDLYYKDKPDMIFVEGQGALLHFATSAALTLIHSSNPDAIVLVHDPQRKFHLGFSNSKIFKMSELNTTIKITESLSLPNGNLLKIVALSTIGQKNISILNKMKNTGEIPNIAVGDVLLENGSKTILKSIIEHLKIKPL